MSNDVGQLKNYAPVTTGLRNGEHRTQVFQATHDGKGNTLPFMNRSFISFSYGGKNIEDFNLIAVTDGDTMTGEVYAPFTDNVTESDIFDGQLYWSTHHTANNLTLTLATDEMSEENFDDFKHWFAPGTIRELIRAEHPNRAILARVATPPQYNLLPFEKNITIQIVGTEYKTSTTVYKGTITLEFVMDDPFWYAKNNFLYYEEGNDSQFASPARWKGVNDEAISVFQDKDALKVIYEDRTPIIGMLYNNFENIGADSSYFENLNNVIFLGLNKYSIYNQTGPYGSYVYEVDTSSLAAQADKGHVAFSLYENEMSYNLPNITSGGKLYFFYGGTAPSYPIIKFTLTPGVFDGTYSSNVSYYISSPLNNFSRRNGTLTYNSIYIECEKTKSLKFSLPKIWAGYNQAVNIFKRVSGTSTSDEEVRELIREEVKHYAPREYAIAIVNDSNFSAGNRAAAMIGFLQDSSSDEILPADFVINNKTGSVQGTFRYRNYDSNTVNTIIEDASDMIKSSYLSIDERNIISPTGRIYPHDNTYNKKSYGYKLTHDYGGDTARQLENFSISYQFMYY